MFIWYKNKIATVNRQMVYFHRFISLGQKKKKKNAQNSYKFIFLKQRGPPPHASCNLLLSFTFEIRFVDQRRIGRVKVVGGTMYNNSLSGTKKNFFNLILSRHEVVVWTKRGWRDGRRRTVTRPSIQRLSNEKRFAGRLLCIIYTYDFFFLRMPIPLLLLLLLCLFSSLFVTRTTRNGFNLAQNYGSEINYIRRVPHNECVPQSPQLRFIRYASFYLYLGTRVKKKKN